MRPLKGLNCNPGQNIFGKLTNYKHWLRPENFDICICQTFYDWCQKLISAWEDEL